MNVTQDTERLLDAIRRMKSAYPDWRIGQLVANVASMKLGFKVESIWDIEDHEFIAAIDDHLAEREEN